MSARVGLLAPSSNVTTAIEVVDAIIGSPRPPGELR